MPPPPDDPLELEPPPPDEPPEPPDEGVKLVFSASMLPGDQDVPISL